MDLPTGTVTFLFTDIEGSTRLLRELGDDYRAVQGDHMRLMREAIAEGGGTVIRTEGDAFFAVFPSATGAVQAAVTAQRAFASHPWAHGAPVRTRMGMHTGEGRLGGEDYLGIDVNRAARIAAAGHGGQVLLSDATRGLVAEALPEGVSLRDLGEHRLKDFDTPQQIHQLVVDALPADFPRLRTMDVPTNLPTELTSFVGRERELEEVKRLVTSARLLTLTGPGGSGKTRLALRAASDLLDRFPDGVHLVELAAVREASLVPSVIASAVGTGELGPRSVMETLEIELRHQELLLVLDNFEQVIEAAPAVGALLTVAPMIRFLVTSRGPLRIQGEQELPVPPLDLPDPDQLHRPEEITNYAATALFVERATAIDPGFTVDEPTAAAIVEICRRLDGLPLAIELAVSRLRLMSPTGILERLDRALPLLAGGSRDVPDRQRTLRGAIGWSYDLLPPETAALFRRVCVFAGGFTIAAADSVCRPDGERDLDTLEGLETLLDTALVRRRPAPTGIERLETLQTVREYGMEQLDGRGEAPDARRRHAAYFLHLAEALAPGFRGPDLEYHLGTFHLEHDNMRAALSWALEMDQGEVALRLVWALWRFWHLHGDLSSGRRWAELALALPSSQPRTGERARALLAAGSLAYWQLDPPATSASYAEALAIFGELEDEAGIAEATYDIAFGRSIEGKVSESAEMFRTSRAMFEALGDRRGVADSLFGLGIVSRLQGEIATARAAGEEALRMHEELADSFGVYGSLYVVGRAAVEQGDLAAGRAHFLRALEMAEEYGDRTGVALSLDNLADQEIGSGHVARAMRLAGASEAIKEVVAGQAPPELTLLPDPRARAREVLSDEQIEEAWQEGRAFTLEEALAFAREEEG
jgi:predicted ATPase/class 3 adenylate cyclase